MKDLEIWKIVELDINSTGLLISSHGNIKNYAFVDRKLGDNGSGYKYAPIKVIGEKRQKTYYIHRLVAQHFLPKPLDHQTQVNHIDGNKENNCVSNLEWICPKENIKHSHETGLSKGRRELGTTVKLNGSVIANAYLSVKIGMYGVREAADKYGMPRTTLSSIMNKRSRRSVTDTIDDYFKLDQEK